MKPQDFASNLKLLSGNQQVGIVGAALSEQLTVKVVDAGGVPVAGATVLWQVRDGGGTINPPASTTGSSGVASVTWTLGTGLVANKAVAILQGNYVLDSAVFTASAKEGPPASMTLVTGAALTARVVQLVSSPLSVVVRDAYGHPIPKVKVTWLPLTAQSGSVVAVNDSTDATGTSTANWTTGTLAATQMAAARLTGLSDVLFTVIATPDTSRRLALVSGDNQSNARGLKLSQPLVVRMSDKYGNVIEGDTVIWNDTIAGGGSVSPTRGLTDVNGLTNATWTLGSSIGAQALRARIGQNRVSFAAIARVGLPKTVTSAGTAQAQRVATQLATPLSIVVRDSLGQSVPGLALTWSTANAGGTIAAQTDTTLADGSASALWTLGTVAGAQSASLTIAGVATPLTFTATAAVDTSRRLTLVSGASQTAGIGSDLSTITVRLADRFGNLIVGDSVFFADSTIGLGSFSSPTVATDATGQASTTWTLGPRVGQQSIRIRLQAPRPEKMTVTATATVQFSDISVGNFHACALATTSKVYCWGLNDVGQLGRGNNRSTTAPTTPVAITADSSAAANTLRARQLTGNRSSVCAVTTAQDVYCWGHQWGPTATTTLPSLTSIKSNGGSGSPLSLSFLQVAEDHGCLIQVSGVANCTGNNDLGQLGDVSAGPPFPSPGSGTWPYVDGSKPYSNLQLGTSFSCGFHRFQTETAPDSSQIPLCWGDGSAGQRGDSTTSNLAPVFASTPKHIKVAGLPGGIAFDSTSLAVGDKHACAVAIAPAAIAGNAYCWGLNAHGQLGNGPAVLNSSRDSSATLVTGGHLFVRLFAGKYHTCGLTAAGVAWCWGRDDYGQLGDGRTLGFNLGWNTPVQVNTSQTFRSLSLGELSTCGVTGTPNSAITGPSPTAGTVYCWGDNNFGQIGNGQTTGATAPVLTPAKVVGQP